MIAQISIPAPGDLEHWLVPAAAVLWLVGQWKKVFPPAKNHDGGFATRPELAALSDKIDARFLGLSEKIDQMAATLSGRLSKVEAAVARLDERTK